ncbi:DNA methyltransferase [Chromobacterium violaceum]|uniref:DNA cytosine methyltransferase n=1 Tax=Chromobacterium violaceum TaxID=536 RepID=UPI000652CEF2|nr:DNA cytosine methyltransferase [Chromobacterium violaceum]KMN48746.1 DNA methyltransferase [Chromobacterium violaceum]KMN87841.1 DNA methyltransferase [Chromobacterium violaceum]KMN89069.1 DNA methyltransferase [Chromobacterium violaceum]KMO05444.1 DNA methyltransferase [Chromobacterium violaceum]
MIRDQFSLLTTDEIIVDLFAGGGGMSSAIEEALGRHVDIAINHDMDAISMHMANHPQTQHYCCDVFEVDPHEACQGRPVGHLHGSPDCTHFSQAVGGQPRSKAIRSLGWVIPRWAGQVKPRIISMENVKQMRQWGPLIAKRCKTTGRVVKLDGSVAEPGERVPVQEQFLIPDPKHIGRTWKRFLSVLRRQGYDVEHDTMIAADYGAATTRDRLYLFARRDGRPIIWPAPTHHEKPTAGQRGWRPAADHIDFSDLGQSIFDRKKPLADATMRRVAKGMKKFVLDSATPFIVELANWSSTNGVQSSADPLRTITAWPRGGSMAVASPVMINAAHGDGKPGRAQRWGDGSRDIQRPIGTVTASGSGGQALAAAMMVKFKGDSIGHALTEPAPVITAGGKSKRPAGAAHALAVGSAILVGVGGRAGQTDPRPASEPGYTTTAKADTAIATAFLAQANGGFNETVGRSLDVPATTITTSGSQQQLVAMHLAHLRGNCDGRDAQEPLRTLSAGGEHHGLVASHLVRQFGKSVGSGADEPVGAIMAGGGGKTSLVSYQLSQEDEAGALRVAAFLISYYGTDNVSGLDQPMPTATTRDRLALVTVWIRGEPWVIVDIKLRMLTPRELYGCQGFAPDYRIETGHDGRAFSKSAQVRMVGNSVSPKPAAALIAANCRDLMAWSQTELKQRRRIAA